MSTPGDSPSYTIRLPDYEGPLDLLLQLIEQEQMDITRLSLAQVTDQYLQFIAGMQRVDAEHIAEFLVVAAKLLLIKSRLLLPQDAPTGAESEPDAGEELTRQLIEYRRYKQVAQQLKVWDVRGLHAFPRIAPRPKVEPRLDLSRVSLADLAALVDVVLAANREAPIGEVVAPLVIRVGDRMEEISARLARGERLSFRQWLAGTRTRIEIIVSFLAVLELMKQRKVIVEQHHTFGDIVISAAPASPPAEQDAPASDSAPEPPSFVEPTS